MVANLELFHEIPDNGPLLSIQERSWMVQLWLILSDSAMIAHPECISALEDSWLAEIFEPSLGMVPNLDSFHENRTTVHFHQYVPVWYNFGSSFRVH
jgi:hypothetical protein